jgi:hypothetical protein
MVTDLPGLNAMRLQAAFLTSFHFVYYNMIWSLAEDTGAMQYGIVIYS